MSAWRPATFLALSPLVLAACAPPPAAPPTTVIELPPAPAPTAQATTPEEQEPAPAPRAVDKGIVPGKSMAGVALGATRADVIRVLGPPEESSEYDGGATLYLNYQSKGISVLLSHGAADAIFGYSGKKGGYETGEFKRYGGSTPEGIGLDAMAADVERAYGQPSDSGDLSMAPVPSRWTVYDDRGVGFSFIAATDEIVTIHVFRVGRQK